MIAQMKSYFVNDYDVTIKTISDEIGDGVEKVEDKDKLKKPAQNLQRSGYVEEKIMKITVR